MNIFSTYCFQALMKPEISFIVSVSRGAVISGLLIYLLPMVAGDSAIWFAMPITELIVGIYVTVIMFRITRHLENQNWMKKSSLLMTALSPAGQFSAMSPLLNILSAQRGSPR